MQTEVIEEAIENLEEALITNTVEHAGQASVSINGKSVVFRSADDILITIKRLEALKHKEEGLKDLRFV